MGYALQDALGAPPREFAKLNRIPARFIKMALNRRIVDEQIEHNLLVSGGTELTRQLDWFSLCCLSVGIIVATGIFSFMPYIYANITGPAVVLSLIIASVTAAVSALIYSEFAVEYPVVGGGFIYVLNTFGEFPAVLCGVNLLIDYIFGTAAVVRNFSVYFAELINKRPDYFQSDIGRSDNIDTMALVICLLLTVVLCLSTKAFNSSNVVLQFFHIFLVLFTIVAALSKAKTEYWSPFFPSSLEPHGARTIVTGASNIFFVFIGYDIVVLGAEEAKTKWSVPVGMVASVAFVTIIYLLLAASLVMLYPFDLLAAQPEAVTISGFAYAFTQRGMDWAKYIVAAGACVGIFTSTGAGIYALSRIFTVFAREGMIPAFFGHINSRTVTPIPAVILAGVLSALIAFFTGFATLANMTSIGTLTMYWFVAISHVYRRYAPGLETEERAGDRHLAIPFRPDPFGSMLGVTGKRALLLFYIFLQTAAPVGYAIYWNRSTGSAGLVIMTCIWFLVTLAIQLTLPITYVPEKFSVPWWAMPWTPAVSVFANVMLIGGFGANRSDYWRLFAAMGIGCVVYWLYGVHVSYHRFHVVPREETESSKDINGGADQEAGYGQDRYTR